jgi:hypothetical protein
MTGVLDARISSISFKPRRQHARPSCAQSAPVPACQLDSSGRCSDRQLVTSSLIASPKDQVVSSGSHPSPAAPVSDPVRVCCVRAKPCPRRLNDQGLLDSYGVYRSPWISCSFARHLRKHRNQWLFSPPLLHQFRSVSSVRSCDRFYHRKKFFNRANRHKHTESNRWGLMRHCLLIDHKNLGPPLWKLSYSGSHPRRP